MGIGIAPQKVIEILVGPRETTNLPARCADFVQLFRCLEGLWVAEGDINAQRKTIVLELERIGRQTLSAPHGPASRGQGVGRSRPAPRSTRRQIARLRGAFRSPTPWPRLLEPIW